MGLASASPSLASLCNINWDPSLCLASGVTTKTVQLLDILNFVPAPLSPVLVYKVDAAGYENCDFSVSSFSTIINALTYTCDVAGVHYFIADRANCLRGLKLQVTVAGAL
ncbi:OLC1v1002236C1 [Oldenlandia corymbosa var. corymbosa]|uniref:OLC1v1002236C1 n=1 Tax=Oldenlandia corymbosa var. corymbosa TaxID=529605 RepID=A0AAV1D7U7_OLDCO|nr:OLC1v1002236C1 [Oldenlandia corymbosa var. corymbosa]